MILPGSLIPSDRYFLKNLTFVVCNPLVWLRHHSSQTLYVARVKSKQLKNSVLPGLPDRKSWRLRTTKVKFFKKYLSEGMSDPGKIIRPGKWMFLTWGRLMKANSQKQRCLALRYDLLECFALLVMECCYSLWPNKRKSSWLPIR